ncbi:MAG: GTPase HflX [Pseudanabaenaceae cyanobacterium]
MTVRILEVWVSDGQVAIDTVFGAVTGLKPSQLRSLQRLYRARLPQACAVTPEFGQRLAALATEIEQPLCVFVNRRGQVVRVGLGTPDRARIPPLELPRYGEARLCGLRCVAVGLERQPPGRAALTALAAQRLDALVWLTVRGGYVDRVYLAHLTVAETVVSPPLTAEGLIHQDFLALVAGLEEEFARTYRAREVSESGDRVILAGLQTQEDGATATGVPLGLVELGQLVESAGGTIADTLWQKRERPHPQTVLGEGKIAEMAVAAQTQGANLIVFDRELSPAQLRNIEQRVGLRVSDRTEIILDIFAQRARSAAGKLQVELAQLAYRLPRLAGRGQALSRLGGGIGTRGPGETKLETDRRAVQKRITRLQQQVNELRDRRQRLRQQRLDREIPTVAIVGYTNAGKSTLLNTLTKAEAYAADRLFATLDPTTRRLNLGDFLGLEQRMGTVLLTDTVGFIRELPPSLVDAFRATLEEVTEADVLLHVVDASHPHWAVQERSVREILQQMPMPTGPILTVFNKCDRPLDLASLRQQHPEALCISAQARQGLEELCWRLARLLRQTVGAF